MIKNRIEAIRATIESAQNIPEERKTELLNLLAELTSEIQTLAQTHDDKASSIASLAEASAQEASRSEKNPHLADRTIHQLRGSIEGLEESHPVIVGIVNRFATALSNMGL
jgi:chromosome segregation ATPase